MGEVRQDKNEGDRWIQHYCSSHQILLVGEGDFSFAASLARKFGDAVNMIATSLDSKGISCTLALVQLSVPHGLFMDRIK
ncbi:hypothetical protein CJ030_MR4G021067 [Morella rubra]|uniref:25S rRNA (uridine-N(3))-methyltransferase BMT5-like domain-containing protein n=1 Tax=Morella rubra TaxID=262757 RepID=A0A6A1VWA6_9ROSI|nr:hypothetical protein CJ030_MR4G021067 [Morella rubra]